MEVTMPKRKWWYAVFKASDGWEARESGAGVFASGQRKPRAQREKLEPHHREAAKNTLAVVAPFNRIPVEGERVDAAPIYDADALIDEASEASFPASDPPG